jgi:hypothetical protein
MKIELNMSYYAFTFFLVGRVKRWYETEGEKGGGKGRSIYTTDQERWTLTYISLLF